MAVPAENGHRDKGHLDAGADSSGPDLAPRRIDLTIDDDDLLTRVEDDLVCAHGTDVRDVRLT